MLIKKFNSILSKIFLNKEQQELAESLNKAGIKGAKVVGRGTIVVEGKQISESSEFKNIKRPDKT